MSLLDRRTIRPNSDSCFAKSIGPSPAPTEIATGCPQSCTMPIASPDSRLAHL